MVDKNMELDLEAMLDNIKDMNIRDPWLLEQTIEDCRTCYAVSSAQTMLVGWKNFHNQVSIKGQFINMQ